MDIVEVAVITTSLTTHKTGTGEGESLAPVQAQAHVPAYAQHTNAHAQYVPIRIRISTFRGRHLYTRGVRTYTPAQLKNVLADKYAKGYVFATIRTTSYLVDDGVTIPRYVPAYAIILDDHQWQNIPAGYPDPESLAHAYRMPTQEGRE